MYVGHGCVATVPIRFLETWVINYHYSLYNNPKECSSNYFVQKPEVTLKKQMYMEHNQSEIVPVYNGSLSCDRHVACS